MMWARSVMRSNTALHNRALGMTCVHSENGRLVVNNTAERSARSEITWNRNSAPSSARGDIAYLVDGDHVVACIAAQDATELELLLGFHQLVDQRRRGDKPRPLA